VGAEKDAGDGTRNKEENKSRRSNPSAFIVLNIRPATFPQEQVISFLILIFIYLYAIFDTTLQTSLFLSIRPNRRLQMGKNLKAGCTRPAAEVEAPAQVEEKKESALIKQGERPMIQIGKKAPDFTASAYFNGEFTSVKLSDYLGKWTLLCFYPGDFTFV